MTFMTTALLRDPVCHPGDWEGVRPWPRPLPEGRGPDGADDRPPVEDSFITSYHKDESFGRA